MERIDPPITLPPLQLPARRRDRTPRLIAHALIAIALIGAIVTAGASIADKVSQLRAGDHARAAVAGVAQPPCCAAPAARSVTR